PAVIVPNVALAAVVLARGGSDLVPAVFWQIAAALLAGAVAYMLERRDRDAFLAARLLAAERARSRALLHNVLPAPIADRLESGSRIADHFEDATVLFADIVGFTPLAEQLP